MRVPRLKKSSSASDGEGVMEENSRCRKEIYFRNSFLKIVEAMCLE